MAAQVFLGIDVGSTTVKLVVLGEDRRLLAWRYLRSHGQPRQTVFRGLTDLFHEVDTAVVQSVGLSGSGSGPIAKLVGGYHVNELVAQTRAVGEYYPQARTVIEIGGQDSKYLSVEWDAAQRKMVLVDFAMNNLCAAGTGSFLDQQAERLGISIEDEFARIALQSDNPARIAGRCTVFAKSDMVHLQQRGMPLPDILAGLGMALARNFRGVIGRGKAFVPPILFQGGVAYNQGVARAFERVLNLKPGELLIPEHCQLMVALGAALVVSDEQAEGRRYPFRSLGPLQGLILSGEGARAGAPVLPREGVAFADAAAPVVGANGSIPVYLGIDVGSITTKVVLIDEQAQVVARRYLYTEGRPLEAVRCGLTEIGHEVGSRVSVQGVGTTGSGRHLTAHYVGADVVRSEITTQARAAIAIDPSVDTIFEIGGQDSKYISLERGTVVNFAMNTACAAGTGSFLQEQADRLEIDLERDFRDLAFSSRCPVSLGERCTVFMESDLVHHQQQGARVQDLVAGLAYAIVENYLNRVVGSRPIGRNVFFQGGVAWNDAVVAAFQGTIQSPVTVPPHHDVTGAIGAAILAKEELEAADGPGSETKFAGFDLRDRHYDTRTFVCRACPNVCEINRFVVAGQPPLFYGARCDMYDRKRAGSGPDLPDLFAERQTLLMGDYQPPAEARSGRLRVGLPRTLFFYDLFPYWRTFFQSLDIDLVLSEATNPRIASLAKEHAVIEACYPARLVYGHVIDLLDGPAAQPKGVDILFLPSIVDRENTAPGQVRNKYCPYIPAMPHLIRGLLDSRCADPRPLISLLHFCNEKTRRRDLAALARELGTSHRRVLEADATAAEAQRDFYAALRRRGRELLQDGLLSDEKHPAAVIVGRSYNTCDLDVSQDLPYKLKKMGVLAVPIELLPLETVDLSDRYPNMYWRSGQDILATARLVRQHPRLQAIYLSNFVCGPDSFLINYFRCIMRGKPFLELELDDHTADAGIVTRCEAFFESLRLHAVCN